MLMVFSLMIVAGAGYLLIESEKEHVEADRSYESLSKQIKREPRAVSAPALALLPEVSSGPQVEIPDIGIDASALDAVGDACIAWLYCPDTVIDYPVMYADNYDYYLTHLPDGTKNKNGALVLD
jgi:sortase B